MKVQHLLLAAAIVALPFNTAEAAVKRSVKVQHLSIKKMKSINMYTVSFKASVKERQSLTCRLYRSNTLIEEFSAYMTPKKKHSVTFYRKKKMPNRLKCFYWKN